VTTTASPASSSTLVTGSTVRVSGPPGRFPLPRGAQVIEDGTDHGHYSIVFGSVSPSTVSRFYATALPQAGYTIISNSSATGDPVACQVSRSLARRGWTGPGRRP
jgi:hypothetical protein